LPILKEDREQMNMKVSREEINVGREEIKVGREGWR
jgi:hypothetical protein